MLTMLRNILCDGYGDRQHCRLSTFTFLFDTESETNPNGDGDGKFPPPGLKSHPPEEQ